jgi:hypothetical protein
MKYVLNIIGLVCLVAAVGCTNNRTPTPMEVATVTQEEHNRLKSQVASLNEELEELREYLGKDPEFFLYLMDYDLNAIERGQEARGSFSDYFVPNAARALKAGASRKDITTRLDRVVTLAEKEIYLSSFVTELMENGGPSAVHSYAFEWIGQ